MQHTRALMGQVVALTAPLPLDTLEIRALEASDAMAFQTLWLEALQEQPDKFGPNFVEERDRPWVHYVQRFRSEWIARDNVILGAFLAGRLVGAIAIRRWEREKQRHKGYIWIFFVDPTARGCGVGRQLLAAGIRYARQLPGLRQLQLSVATDNGPAQSLYRSFGFEPFGCEWQALKGPNGFIDLELLALHFQ